MSASLDLATEILRLRWLIAAENFQLCFARSVPPTKELGLKCRQLEWSLAARRFQLAYARHVQALVKAGFNPDQPRVPAGNPDGGQWANEGGSRTRVRLAASDKPRLGPGAIATLALEVATRVIKAYRSENGLWDLFGRKDGTVTVTTLNGSDIFGSNSGSPTYTSQDRIAAEGMRNALIEKYPGIMDSENIGRRPNDALFHAETTVLLRAARENGGTLAGQTLEVFGDKPLCYSCRKVLPYVGLELGNPEITFVDSTGLRWTIHNGTWVK